MKEIGCVKNPMFGRTSISRPSSTNVFCPSFGARHGVAGASRMSTSRRGRGPRRETCGGISALAPPRRRKHRAGDKPVANVGIEIRGALAQPFEMKRRAFDHRDEIGGRTRLIGLGEFDDALRLERASNGVDGEKCAWLSGAREIAAERCDTKPLNAVFERWGCWRCGNIGLRRVRVVAAEHGVVGEREIANGSRERSHMIETGDERERAGARQSSIGGFRPNTPQKEEGTRMEPLVSDPSAIGTRPPATAAADPPDDPPVMWPRSCGLREGP